MVIQFALLGAVAAAGQWNDAGEYKLVPAVEKWVDRWQTDKAAQIVKLKKEGAPQYRFDRSRAQLPDAPGVSYPLKVGMIGTFDDFSAVQFLEVLPTDERSFLGRVTIRDAAGPVRYLATFRGFDTDGLKRDSIVSSDGFLVVVPAFDHPAALLVFEAVPLELYCKEWARLHPDAEKPVVKNPGPLAVVDPGAEPGRLLEKARGKIRTGDDRRAVDQILRAIVRRHPTTDEAVFAHLLLKRTVFDAVEEPTEAELAEARVELAKQAKGDRVSDRAAASLRAAKLLWEVDQDKARKRLKELIEKYPETEAAGEARKLLK
jgi:hypothetical protein